MTRPIEFRAWVEDDKEMLVYSTIWNNRRPVNLRISQHGRGEEIIKKIHLMQYTGIKDKNDVKIFEDDLLNVHFTSYNKLHIHDCIYRVEIGILGDIQLQYVNLLWCSNGYNQIPSSQTLRIDYDTLSTRYIDGRHMLLVPDKYDSNPLRGEKWKTNDESFYFEVIGNIHENPELLEFPSYD